jgi:hypothetical protein
MAKALGWYNIERAVKGCDEPPTVRLRETDGKGRSTKILEADI